MRSFLGFRRVTVDDSKTLADWLRCEVLPVDSKPEHLKQAALDWCRRNQVVPPTATRLDRILRSAIFLCRYLHAEVLRQEVQEALNVIEQWNGTNGFIFFGKGGEIATNRLEDQEVSVLCLHLLQICLVYINTLMIQNVLAEPAWMDRMAEEDFRALSPLIYNYVNPYGSFEIDNGQPVAP